MQTIPFQIPTLYLVLQSATSTAVVRVRATWHFVSLVRRVRTPKQQPCTVNLYIRERERRTHSDTALLLYSHLQHKKILTGYTPVVPEIVGNSKNLNDQVVRGRDVTILGNYHQVPPYRCHIIHYTWYKITYQVQVPGIS